MPLIQVTMVEGRTVEQKHALIRNLSQSMAETLEVPLERIRVAIYEVTADEWGIGGQPFSAARPGGVAPPSS
jgi:4-oxalocrotonate tautomerase